MCGIAGFVGGARDRERAREELAAMCAAIVHRGPDDEGQYVTPEVALGIRRLSVIDVAGGHQPIANEDGTVHLVFNGEVYNYRELQQRLRARGHRLATRSDTETIVHLYEEHGDALVDALRGMFAFALWDGRRRRLLLARDRLGEKPLYYWERPDGIAFSSELKALLRLPGLPRRIDDAALADYLALGYVPDPASIYRDVRKLPPGHTLTWDREGGAVVRRYWSPLRPPDPTIREGDAIEEVRRLLAEAVRYRLVADVPVGAFLSGGLDSSAVVAEMARQMDRPVRTFSLGFDDPAHDESRHARSVARALGTEHTELVVRPPTDRQVEQAVLAFDEPFADSCAIAIRLVAELARADVTVALSGDGGDEVFGGYTRYLALLRRDARLTPLMRAALGSVARRLPHGTRGRNRLLDLSRSAQGRYAGTVAHALLPADGGVASAALARAGHGMDDLLERWYREMPPHDRGTQATLVDLLSYLPGDILTMVDRMTMAVSLEARPPLLDHVLVEFAAALPGRFRFRDGTGRWVWRQAIRGLVPDEVLTRPKQGLSLPLRGWLDRELAHWLPALLRPNAAVDGYLSPAAVRRVVAEHRARRRDHSAVIWRLLVLQRWMEQVHESPVAASA